MMVEGKELRKSGIKIKIEKGNEDHQSCHEMQRSQGKVIEIGNMYTITEKRDLDIIDCKVIEVVGVNCLVSAKEGKMPRGSKERVGILREENLAEAGHLEVRNLHNEFVLCWSSGVCIVLYVPIAFCIYM
jgi:hypothetical protein